MLILSQDKNRIINFNNVNQIFIVGKEIFADTEKSINLLGEYKTSARTKEVLQEIISFYFQTEYFKSICNISYISSEQLNETQEKILVYEIPEK